MLRTKPVCCELNCRLRRSNGSKRKEAASYTHTFLSKWIFLTYSMCNIELPNATRTQVVDAHVCSRTLTYADVCNIELPNASRTQVVDAHVCSRKLTDADVCYARRW